MRLPDGATIGRYAVLAEIGRGAMGVVYKARDPHIDRLVAIKMISLIDQEPDDDQDYRQRFLQEAKAAGCLSHPGVVTIFDVGEEQDGSPFIVMEYVAGRPASKLLAADKRRLPLGAALQLGQEVAEALDYAHRHGVIHRDVKPANILVTRDGHCKIADFGIARFNQYRLTQPGRLMGSPSYMAPEQFEGGDTDSRSDLFSLGVALYTVLTGHRPFQGNTAASVCFKLVNRDPLPITAFDPQYPAEIDELVFRALSKDPARRYQTGAEMADRIRQFRETHGLSGNQLARLPMVAEIPKAKTDLPVPLDQSPAVASPVEVRESGAAPGTARAFKWPSIDVKAVLAAAGLLALAGLALWFPLNRFQRFQKTTNAPITGTAPSVQSTNPSAASLESSKTVPEKPDASQNSAGRTVSPGESQLSSPVRVPRHALLPRPVSAAKTPSAPASAQPREQQVVSRGPDAVKLQISIQHSFTDGNASVWVDSRLVHMFPLHGESKRRAVLFHHLQGEQSGTISLTPGNHQIEVRVQAEEAGYDQSGSITQNFSSGSVATLQINCDKQHKKIELSLK
jgi:eukaryotic-like serine/threonine-protein kinase